MEYCLLFLHSLLYGNKEEHASHSQYSDCLSDTCGSFRYATHGENGNKIYIIGKRSIRAGSRTGIGTKLSACFGVYVA